MAMNEQLMSDEDKKGLILGSLASGVLSAIIGARSGNIDPMAAGLAGAGTAFAGGSKQISDIRMAAQNQKNKERAAATAEEAAADLARHRRSTELLMDEQTRGLADQRTANAATIRAAAEQRAAEEARFGAWAGDVEQTHLREQDPYFSGREGAVISPGNLAILKALPSSQRGATVRGMIKPPKEPGMETVYNPETDSYEKISKTEQPGGKVPVSVKAAEVKATTTEEATIERTKKEIEAAEKKQKGAEKLKGEVSPALREGDERTVDRMVGSKHVQIVQIASGGKWIDKPKEEPIPVEKGNAIQNAIADILKGKPMEGKAPAPGKGKLDADTAQKFLTKAGGDKNKARELARKEGYQF